MFIFYNCTITYTSAYIHYRTLVFGFDISTKCGFCYVNFDQCFFFRKKWTSLVMLYVKKNDNFIFAEFLSWAFQAIHEWFKEFYAVFTAN